MKSTRKVSVVAYSYVRFSTPEQSQGDSLRRQTELAERYCERKGWVLDGSTYRDLGVRAFKGKDALVGNLGEFLKAVRSGAVKPGSALIVESLDRTSRQGVKKVYDLVRAILEAGVLIVTLSPEREFDVTATEGLAKGLIEILLILDSAAGESERKSERVKQAQQANLVRAREGKEVLSRRLPAWVEKRDGKATLIPRRAN